MNHRARHEEREELRRKLPQQPKAPPPFRSAADDIEMECSPFELRSPASLTASLRRFEKLARAFEGWGAWEAAADVWATFYRFQDHKERAVRRALGRR